MAAAGLAVVLAAAPARAQRDDPGLQAACAQDFLRLCGALGVDPNNEAETERCMNRSRARFSPECKAAISDYDRRAASPRGR